MRVSVNKDDPWCTRYPFAYRVKFNNKHIYNCMLADEQLGLVEVYNKADGCDFILDGDCVKTHFEVGSVKIERRFFTIIKSLTERVLQKITEE